jgi:hypothetical protein
MPLFEQNGISAERAALGVHRQLRRPSRIRLDLPRAGNPVNEDDW